MGNYPKSIVPTMSPYGESPIIWFVITSWQWNGFLLLHHQFLSPIQYPCLLDNILQEYKKVLGEKFMVAKLLLCIQQTCKECEILLCSYLSQEDIEQVAYENNSLENSDSTTIGAKYLHVVCNQSLRLLIASVDIVSQSVIKILLSC